MANKNVSPVARTVKRIIIFVLVVIILLVGLTFAVNKIFPRDYSEYVTMYANKYGVDEALVYAVIKTESNFDETAVSSENAKGLMQIQKNTFEWVMTKMGVEGYLHTYDQVLDPEVNIKYGTFLLSILLDEYGDEKTALCAYNAGRSIVNDWLKTAISSDAKKLDSIPSSLIETYVNKVERTKSIYEKLIK